MARDICIQWLKEGIEPFLLTLFDEPTEMAPEFATLGISVSRASLRREHGHARYLSMIARVAATARRLRPQAVLSMPFGWHVFVAIGAKLARVPRVVAHVGSYPVWFQEPGFWKFQTEVFAGRPVTDRLICCSEYVRKGVLEHMPVSARSTAVVYNGSDLEDIARRAEVARRGRQPGPFRVGMVARLEKSKDHSTLISAAALLGRSSPVELWLVGDGSHRAALEDQARANPSVNVQFLGARRDVPELLGQMDAFAYSAKPEEGLGIALIEAIAARVPVVATDVGGCREVLEGGAWGTLVPYRDAVAMARALEEIAHGGGDGLAERLERAALSADARFSRRAMANGYARELGLGLS